MRLRSCFRVLALQKWASFKMPVRTAFVSHVPAPAQSNLPQHQTKLAMPVSKYFKIEQSDIQAYLVRKSLQYKERNFTHKQNKSLQELEDRYNIRDCPFCHDTKQQLDNVKMFLYIVLNCVVLQLYKLFIFKDSGGHFCHRCKASGSLIIVFFCC